MLQQELNREQVMQLGEQILGYMENRIIARGYEYFSQGLVFNIHVFQDALITSDVQGTQVYHVEIHLASFPDSSCTCPYPHYCKHLAATFLQIYSLFANPKLFLQKAQQPRAEIFSASMLYPVLKQPGRQYQHPAPSISNLTAKSTIKEWWLFFQSWTRNLSADMERHRLFSELRHNYERALGVTSSWQRERAHLFTIHAILHHLQKLEEYAQQMKIAATSQTPQDFTRTVARFLEELEGTLFHLDKKNVPDEDLAQTLRICKEIGSESAVINWVLIMQIVWWYLLDSPAKIRAEASDLQRKLENTALSMAEIGKLQQLNTHFAVINGQDEQALQVWSQLETSALSTFLFYVKVIARKDEWHRLLTWFDKLTELIKKLEDHEYRLVTAIWRHALEKAGRLQEWGMHLKVMLPRSFLEYAAFLYEKRSYQQWIDLQMAKGATYLDIQAETRQIEEANATLLLPFYIREINRLIQTRNRNAYKEAIKLIKKVRTCYIHADQENRWGSFIKQLSGKYKRLRTFQEELRRGNLFS